jgi:hypothetical protein
VNKWTMGIFSLPGGVELSDIDITDNEDVFR